MCEKILLISEKQEDLGLFNKIFGNNQFVITQSPSAKRIQKETHVYKQTLTSMDM